MYKYILLLHVLGATVWTGGHIVLACSVLPRAMRERSCEALLQFETGFEKLGLPALVIQALSGLWLLSLRLPSHSDWLSLETPDARLGAAKIVLLLATVALAVNARLRVIPHLDAGRLPVLAWHIAGVTLMSVLFVAVGVAFRTGGVL